MALLNNFNAEMLQLNTLEEHIYSKSVDVLTFQNASAAVTRWLPMMTFWFLNVFNKLTAAAALQVRPSIYPMS